MLSLSMVSTIKRGRRQELRSLTTDKATACTVEKATVCEICSVAFKSMLTSNKGSFTEDESKGDPEYWICQLAGKILLSSDN